MTDALLIVAVGALCMVLAAARMWEVDVQDLWGNDVYPWWDKNAYCSPIRQRSRIRSIIGHIKPRQDGRWDWWVRPSKFLPGWVSEHAQGVADSREEAVSIVENGRCYDTHRAQESTV